MDLYFSTESEVDLIEIWAYIAKDREKQAEALVERIYKQCENLTHMPEMGRRRDDLAPGIRTFPVGRYIIFYRIHEESVEIVRILSGYRDIDSLFE